MQKKFIEKESHKHKLAKELLASWLKENNILPFPRLNQNWPIGVELKFYETSDPNYYEHPQLNKGTILFVPDITLFHKGQATCIIEVVHKSRLTNDKIEKIKRFFTPFVIYVYEIEAEEILKQIAIPKKLKCNLIYSDP